MPLNGERAFADRIVDMLIEGIIALVWGAPLALILIAAFFSLNFGQPNSLWSWVGFEHFADTLTNAGFWLALLRTLTLAVLAVSISFVLAAIVGWALAGVPPKIGRIIVGISCIPLFLPPVTTALVWYFQFNPQYGPAGYWFYSITGVAPLNAKLAFWAILLVEIWKLMPFFVLFFYVSIISFEPSLRDTLLVFRLYDRVSLVPLLVRKFFPSLSAFLALGFAMSLRSFEAISTITGGGPGTETETLPILIYRLGLQRFELGAAASVSVVYDLLLCAVFLVIWTRMLRDDRP